MEFRKLKPVGSRRFEHFLSSLKSGELLEFPDEILYHGRYSEVVCEVHEEASTFDNRYDLGAYLVTALKQVEDYSLEYHAEFWNWIAAYFFTSLCEKNSDGEFVPRAMNRWVLDRNQRYFYRHLFAGTYSLCKQFEDDLREVRFLLLGHPSKPGEIVEQLTARQQIVNFKSVLRAASILYYRKDRDLLKRGSMGKDKGGTVRRFGALVNQLSCSWDFDYLDSNQLLAMLPNEFEMFKK